MPGRSMSADRAGLQRAMWSIYYHAFFQAGFGAPAVDREALVPVPLLQALEILAGSANRATQVRALAKLAAADMIRRERLATLQEPGGREVHERLTAIAASLGMNLGNLEKQKPMEAASAVVGLDETPGCGPKDPSCVASFDPFTMMSTVVASGQVRRTIAQLKTSLDPRNWDKCADVFVDAHRVSRHASSTDPRHPGYVDSSTEPVPTGEWLLYEHVRAGAGVFRNVLKLTFNENSSAADIQWDYDLDVNLETSVLGAPGAGVLTDDYGFLRATRIDDDWSEVMVKKSVRSTNEAFNIWAAPILALWLEDTTGMSCC